MKILRQALVLLTAGAMVTPALSAQSFWQKVKQSAQQAERNAQAQQRQRQAQSGNTTRSTAATQNTQSTTADSPAAAPVNVDSSALKALYRKLDVDGVQIGMKPEEASAILLRRTPSFIEQKTTYAFTDLPNTALTSSIHFRAAGITNENIILGLTLQPMQPEVLSIFRVSNYEIDHQPTGENTIAALRTKYGPESIREDNPAMETMGLTWVFDGEGNLLSKAGADKMRTVCGGVFREPTAGWVNNDGVAPHWRENCGPYTIMIAALTLNPPGMQSSNGQSLPPGLLSQLKQVVVSYPLFSKTLAETRQMVLAAKDANVQKNKKAADKNVPTL